MVNAVRSPHAARLKILIVDDHPVVQEGLAHAINTSQDLCVCGGAESSAQALQAITQLAPDVVIVDIALGEEDGLDLIRQINQRCADLPILAMSMHDETLYAERALRAGAGGYVMKQETMPRIIAAVRRVLGGDIYVSEKMASRMVGKLIKRSGMTPASPMETLSDRQFEVFNHIANGTGPSEIAAKMGVSVKTVETHREQIKKKLGLKNGAELLRFSMQWATQQQ
jgi:DNA-binding NarL/FixJ family response regulator